MSTVPADPARGAPADPPAARPTTDDQLRFTPQPPVVWFSPSELALTAKTLIISKIFGNYADKRELIGTFPDPGAHDYTDRGELWVDFVADLGDGFDATYSVASLLAAPELKVADPASGETHTIGRGDVLVMGGDEVYPAASIENYEERTVGPYRAAFPYHPPGGGPAPELFAIPGNHDWYDGLTSWMRIFAQRKDIGGWRTRQARSYFALRLGSGWWLWGIDVQFDSYIDALQLDYFKKIVAEQVEQGDQIILCSASPDWVNAHRSDPESFRTLDYFERTVIGPSGAELRVALSGDLHHYAHYASVSGDRHRLTSGGGGAYLAATHDLPERLTVPPAASTDRNKSTPVVSYERGATFPDVATSRRLGRGVWGLGFNNPSFAGLVGLIYAFYALAALVLPARGEVAAASTLGELWRGYTAAAGGIGVVEVASGMVAHPLALLVSTVVVTALFTMTKRRGARRLVVGAAHLLVQAAVLVAVLTGVFAAVGGMAPVASFVVGVGGAFVAGAVVGPLALAGYLSLGDRFGRNVNEQFSSMHREDYKNFLRMHVGSDGALTIYPVGLREPVHSWRLDPDARPEDPWLVPDGEAFTPELISAPIRLERHPPTGATATGTGGPTDVEEGGLER